MSIATRTAKLLQTLRSSLNPPARLPSDAKTETNTEAEASTDSETCTDAETTLMRLAAEPWNLDEVTPTPDGRLSLRGWAFNDPSLPLDQQAQRFTVNDEPPHAIDYPQLRPDVQAVFWQRPQADLSGFMISVPASYPGGVMRLRFADSMTTREAAARETIYLPDPALHLNLPDADRRFRVIGNRDPFGFLQLGCTDGNRIKAAYEAVTGAKWLDASAVLDWGSGCGRVARHLAPELGSRFYGCDIDADNVRWCNANLPGTYSASTLEPPLPYANETFDIIYGISVFTHLRANWESTWLEELRRVLRPGGTMLMTVHGQTAIEFAALDRSTCAALMDRVEREGLAVTSDNHQLDGFVESPQEYVNVFHSHAHIQRVWSQYFSKIVQLKGYIFTHDLLVVTK